MSYIYPKTINGSTGRSAAHHTQEMSNKSNLCSDSTALAYWGTKTPIFVGNYLRNYPDSVTSIAGSYNKPEYITATNWDTGNIPKTAIVKKITIEYKWEQVSYSCGAAACFGRFDKPTLTIRAKGKNITSWKGAKPEMVRYNNNKTNASKMNTNNAELSTLHKKTIDVESKKLTIADLRKMELIFNPAANTYTNHCRIVMQFIRINITYKTIEVPPILRISSTINPSNVKTNESFTYKATVKSQNGQTKPTTVKVDVDNDIDIISYNCSGGGSFNRATKTWTIKKFSKTIATLTIKGKSSKEGQKSITSKINTYADTKKFQATSKVTVTKVEPNTISWHVTIDGHYPPYTFVANEKKCLRIDLLRDQDQPNREEKFIIDTDGWIKENNWVVIDGDSNPLNVTITQDENNKGLWTISNITGKKVQIKTIKSDACIPIPAGDYHIQVTHKEKGRLDESKDFYMSAIGEGFAKDFFKLRLEDGSDVRYNSLMFTPGDDLKYPLEYQITNSNNFIEDLIVKGEHKRIPTKEYRYVGFDILLQPNLKICSECGTLTYEKECPKCKSENLTPHIQEYKNVLCSLDVQNMDYSVDMSDIIVASDLHTQIITKTTVYDTPEEAERDVYYCKSCGTYTNETDICPTCQSTDLELSYYCADCEEFTTNDEECPNCKGDNIKYTTNDMVAIVNSEEYEETEKNITKIFCVIDSITTNVPKKINFVVKYDAPEKCFIKLKPFNCDEYENPESNWERGEVEFHDIPNIKLAINPSITDMKVTDTVEIQYIIENRSHIDGENIRFKIDEPHSFTIEQMDINGTSVNYLFPSEEQNKNWFNERSRIITFSTLEGQQINANGDFIPKPYILTIKYKPTKRGVYDFSLLTYDDPNVLDDDQWENKITQKIMVDIDSDIKANTSISKVRPYVDELIDFKIKFKNFNKEQEQIIFNINIPDDAKIEYFNVSKGELESNIWTINNVDIDDEEELIITMRFTNTGNHTIDTTLIDAHGNKQKFENDLVVLERNKQLDFNVYHAIGDGNCSNIDLLTEICDNDFINVNDTIYYVIEVTNNNRNSITTNTHIYARLPSSFLENGILCHTDGYNFIQDNNNLLKINIPRIESCSTIRFCFKIQPNKAGTYVANFMLTNRNASVYHKSLTLNVDTDFNQKKMEHEITIYNFEKTNRYFRYELDGSGNIYKFFNKGDKSVRTVDVENYNKGSIETYKGTNLNKIVRDIKENSKYVEPELLKIGTNKFADKGYEMYPDGFIHRFGLLNSEIFHYAGQLPTINNMADYAMRWNVDTWDTKVWGGDIYDNGVFNLSIDYDKVPKNFDILNVKNPLNNLQAMVNRVKPYGTKAICLYANTVYLDMRINAKLKNPLATIKSNLNIPAPRKLGLISLYNRHDNTLAYYYDMFNVDLNPKIQIDPSSLYDVKVKNYYVDPETNETDMSSDPNLNMSSEIGYSLEVFDHKYSKDYIKDCLDIVKNLYGDNHYIKNIDILKEKEFNGVRTRNNWNNLLNQNTILNFAYEKGNEDLVIRTEEYTYTIKYIEDNINNFNGYIIEKNQEIIFTYNTDFNIEESYIQIQSCDDFDLDTRTIHIWIALDRYYYHIGYIESSNIDSINVSTNNYTSMQQTTEDKPISFKITDKINTKEIKPNKVIQFDDNNKWKNLDNILQKNYYASFENTLDIDTECKDAYVTIPPIAIKYNDIPLSNNDEILDIKLKLKAHSNKQDFAENTFINIHKDGDKFIPENNIAREIHYPTNISNINQEYITNIILQQPNITICANCLSTHLGYYDVCPTCESDEVSHYNEKKSVTICENCGWIEDGWHEYCTHCLSEDVTKTKVDFNKTYCYECQSISNEYYERCPKCFSSNVLHMTNDEKRYKIDGEDAINIDPIVIKTNTNRVNLFNIKVPVNQNKDDIELLEKLNLHIHGYNNNEGIFYYCPKCHNVELIHTNMCSNCGHKNIELKTFNNFTMDIYYKVNGEERTLISDKITKIDKDNEEDQLNKEFDIPIDLLSLIKETTMDHFVLSFYIENLFYDEAYNTILKLNTDDDNKYKLINNIPIIDTIVDNIYIDYKYKNENEWQGLNKIEGQNHTGISYTTKDETKTDYINFKNFDIEKDDYTNFYFYIAGINKSDTHIKMNLFVDINDDTYTINDEYIDPDIFSTRIDLSDFISGRTNNISIRANFENVNNNTDIIITHCYIVSEKYQDSNLFDTNIKKVKTNITKENDVYCIESSNKMWGLKDEFPYYVDGRQMLTNLACYIDFGKLNANEYIRLYDVNLLVIYKNRYGKIITKSMALENEEHTKQMILGNINKYKAETWGVVKSSDYILNNLESDFFNSNDEEILTAIPLHNTIAQAFRIPTSEISKIELQHFGQAGYPDDTIAIEIYDDDQGRPNSMIYHTEEKMPFGEETITIDIDVDDIAPGELYWLVLKDDNADKHNYHRFRYNINDTEKITTINGEELDNSMWDLGTLLITKEEVTTNNPDISLSMNIYTGYILAAFYNLPTSLDLNYSTDFKVHQNFYRYNTNSVNNAYLSNYIIKTGYVKYNTDDEVEEE